MTATLRATLHAIRAAPERLAHAHRRRAARKAVRARGPYDSLVFVCHGNVCRSPFAAALASSKLGRRRGDIAVASAGFIGPGRAPPAEALAAASRLGIDLQRHRSQLVSALQFSARPLVLVMHEGQQRALLAERPALEGRVLVLGDFDPAPIDRREIRDPWGGAAGDFDASYARLTHCVMSLLRGAVPVE